MSEPAQGNNTVVAIKAQADVDTLASGAGAAAIEVRPSAGLSLAVATIESTMLHRSNMKLRPRQGSRSATAAYETELQAGNLDPAFAGVLGTTDAAASLTEADLTSVAISGTGTILTFGGGDLVALNIYAGRFVKFASLATSGNNGVWVPILSVDPTAKTAVIPTGYLVDETADVAFTMTLAKAFRTVSPRPRTYYTLEEYLDIDRTKLGKSMRFTGLNFGAAANQDVTAGFTMAGLDLDLLATGSSPTFSSPTFGAVAGAESMSMLDGALYVNGVDTINITGLTMGLSSNSIITPLLRRRVGLGVGVPSFAFAGQVTGLVTDGDAFDDFNAETQLSLMTVFRQAAALSSDFVGVFVPNASYGNWTAPIADGDAPLTLPLYAGRETRAAADGWPEGTVMVVSTSAP